MLCRFDIDGSVDNQFVQRWDKLTKGEPIPSVVEMDISSVPNVGEDIVIHLTYGDKVVELTADIERRTLFDIRRNEGVASSDRCIHYWVTLRNLKCCLYETIRKNEK